MTATTHYGNKASVSATRIANTSTTRIVQKRWIRHDRPIWPFVWRGLLPLLGLLLLAWFAFWPFARSDIEANVLRETREQLAAKGYGWVNVAVSGQHVTLSGSQPKAGDGDTALAIAREASCPTWLGRRTCAVAVTGQFADAAPAPAPVAVAPAPAPKAAAEACEKSLAAIVAKTKINFATGSAVIAASSNPVLDALAAEARKCPGQIRVEGHTDSRGAADANKALSLARANAVRDALVKRGIAEKQLLAEGFGPDKSIADNATDAGRAQNRRIDFRVVTQ